MKISTVMVVCGWWCDSPHIRISVTSIFIQISTLSPYTRKHTQRIFTHFATHIHTNDTFSPHTHTHTHWGESGYIRFAYENYTWAHTNNIYPHQMVPVSPALQCDSKPTLPPTVQKPSAVDNPHPKYKGWRWCYRSHIQSSPNHATTTKPPNANRRRVCSVYGFYGLRVHVFGNRW